jgi:hypothetical protein
MTTVEEEKNKALHELRSFKKEFPLGFGQVFGRDISTIKDHIRTSVSGLMQPIKNKIGQIVSDLLSETGLLKLVENIATSLSNIIIDIKKKDGVDDLINAIGVQISGGEKAISLLLGWIADLWVALEILLGNIPEIPTGIITLPISPIGGGPGDLPLTPMLDYPFPEDYLGYIAALLEPGSVIGGGGLVAPAPYEFHFF